MTWADLRDLAGAIILAGIYIAFRRRRKRQKDSGEPE